jgi:tRNA-splicing ligase RtcB
MDIQGKVNTAHIFTDKVDSASMKQIYDMLSIPCFADSHIAIMPDVHLGKGSVIGFTMTFNGFVNPNVVGVDIGCGIEAFKIGKTDIDFEEFDSFIRSRIPSGTQVHSKVQHRYFNEIESLENTVLKVLPNGLDRVMKSIGTLGGGNHFIEIDKDKDNNLWLVLHSGSRNFGLQVCQFHQKRAKTYLKSQYNGAGAYHGAEYLPVDEGGADYLEDMKIAQEYAIQNRHAMAAIILQDFFGLRLKQVDVISSLHNYINFKDNIVRKGAISAHKDELVIIPLNMRDGCIIAKGRGNEHWNFSAPHGAGRILSRSAAQKQLSMKDFTDSMKGIWSSSVHKRTLDESPMAYKDADDILNRINDTVEVLDVMKPVYNFKA